MQQFPGMTLTLNRAKSYFDSGVWTDQTFIDVMEQNAARFGHLVHRDDTSTLTYAGLWEESESVAAHLVSIGIQRGDKVAIQLPTSLDFLTALFGITRVGATAVILQADLGRQSIEESLRQSETSVLIVASHYQGHPTLKTAIELSERLPLLRAILVAGADDSEEPLAQTLSSSDRLPLHSFTAIRTSGQKLSPSVAAANRPRPLDPFVMVFTAGTTGSPKGIVHLHANTLWCARTYAGMYNMQQAEGMLCLAPVYHLTGFLVGITMPVVTGSRMLLQGRFAASRTMNWIETEQPNYIVGAPPHLIHIANARNLAKAKVSSVKMFFYAGAPVPSAILHQLQADTGWIVGAMFGWSEGFLATATRPDDPVEAINQTVGHVIPGVEVRLADDNGNPVSRGFIGEMWARGPGFSAGYYNQPEAASEKWDSDGWFHSGDLLRQDADGRYVYKGRRDNIINRGGTKIDPREVEAVIAKYPGVLRTVVLPVPDDTLGHKTAAVIVPSDTETVFTLQDLRSFLTESGLAKYQLPDMLEFVALPPGTDRETFGTNELRELAQTSLAK